MSLDYLYQLMFGDENGAPISNDQIFNKWKPGTKEKANELVRLAVGWLDQKAMGCRQFAQYYYDETADFMDRTSKEQIIQVGPLQLWLFCYGFSSNELTADNVRFYFAVDAKILASYGVGSFRVVTLDEVGFCDASTKQQAFDLISEHEYKHNNKHWINVGFQVAYITDLQYDVLIRRYRAYSAGGIQFNVSEVKVYE